MFQTEMDSGVCMPLFELHAYQVIDPSTAAWVASFLKQLEAGTLPVPSFHGVYTLDPTVYLENQELTNVEGYAGKSYPSCEFSIFASN
jgi:hypothetical protein